MCIILKIYKFFVTITRLNWNKLTRPGFTYTDLNLSIEAWTIP